MLFPGSRVTYSYILKSMHLRSPANSQSGGSDSSVKGSPGISLTTSSESLSRTCPLYTKGPYLGLRIQSLGGLSIWNTFRPLLSTIDAGLSFQLFVKGKKLL